MKKVFFLCFLQFQFLSNLFAQQPYLVKDVDSTVLGSEPINFVQVGNYAYFSAWNNKYGREVWKTDGTAAGTVLLKDLYLGPGSSNPRELYNHNGTLYFFSTFQYPGTVNTGYGLWKSDGTEQGTVLIKTFSFDADAWFESMGNDLYFIARPTDGNRLMQLWKTDGTAVGTVMLTSSIIHTASGGPYNLTKVGNLLFFAVAPPYNATKELWRSDGTVNGTYRIKEVEIEKRAISQERNMLSFKNKLYFVGGDYDLWVSDGTEAGTLPVYEFTGLYEGVYSILHKTTDSLYFKAYYGGVNVIKHFVSDGTTVGTKLSDVLNNLGVGGIQSFNDELYLLTSNSKKLLKLAGSSPVELTTISCEGCYIPRFYPSNNGVYFINSPGGSLPIKPTEIWFAHKGNTTPVLLKSGFVSYDYPYPNALFNDKLIISMLTPDKDREPWISDGSIGGTSLLKNVNDGTPSSDPYNVIKHKNNVSFFAKSATRHELWTYNSADLNSHLIVGFEPNSIVKPYGLTSINNYLYFGKQSSPTNHQVWRSDGTSFGALAFQSVPGAIENLTYFDNHLFFRASNRLYRSDSTGERRDIFLPGNIDAPMAVFNGSLYFSYNDNSGIGYEFFKLNPNSSSPILVKDIYTGANNASPQNYLNHNNSSLYFSIVTDFNYLFHLDTQSNLKQIRNTENEDQHMQRSIMLHNRLVYTSSGIGSGGYFSPLSITDTTRAGTILLKEFVAFDRNLVGVKDLTFYRNKIYFTVFDSASGLEVWMTDGTKNGTKLLKDIYPGTTSSMPSDLYVANGLLYFSATHPLYGRELWRTDGTEAGTKIVYDLNTGVYSSNPAELMKVGDKLFFKANDGRFGIELWAINLAPCADNLVLNSNISNTNTDYEAEQEISATSQIKGSSKVKFDAGNSIVLKPGFRVDSGSVFRAIIDGCGNN